MTRTCYLHHANRGERRTLDALKVADGYVENDMPNGWMLLNDGYGCGYEDLAETAEGLQDRKMQLGLWTEDGIDKLADQVKAGQRVAKLDVAWAGEGYKFALDGCKDAYAGIEANKDTAVRDGIYLSKGTWTDYWSGHTYEGPVTVSAPRGQELGAGVPGKAAVDVTAGTRDATGVEVFLDAPEGRRVTPAEPVARIAAGTTRRVEVAVTPAKSAKAGETTLSAAVRRRAAGQDRTSVQCFAVDVMPQPPEAGTWASDMVWLRSVNGYGPAERDRSNGESGAADGRTLTLAGKTYEKGIGAHADSGIEVRTGGRCTAFSADAGIDDEINGYGEVAFSVEADGKVLWTSPRVTGASATVPVNVALDGARHVRLKVTDTNGSKSGDHGDWAAARFSCS